ncbi:MAG: putative Fe-S cluster assembly protein SufT [Candidatus Binatia bacterium]|nr:MAG: putative Fe-S cluster assembly protein SufT [Candidatus Binatia bacterium]
MAYEEVELSRDCEAIQVPEGTKVVLPRGTRCTISQALGDSYTVQVPRMGLFRIAGKDADALGKTPAPSSRERTAGEPASEDDVWRALKEVYDPEIPVNIVDLGLVYDLRVEATPAGKRRVRVAMTLTAPGCGMGQVIAMDAKQRIEALPGVEEAQVELVWDPPWNPQMISPEGREKLGIA